MLNKIVLVFWFLVVSLSCFAQKDINNYKYILVPEKYSFLSQDNQYQLNALTKFLFNKYGYKAFMVNDELPEDLIQNRCLALNSEVEKLKGGMFKSKVEISLKDCYGNIVVTSKIGESREKEYDKAYTEALREAFSTFREIDYSYKPASIVEISENLEPVSLSDQNPELPEPKPTIEDNFESTVGVKTFDYRAEHYQGGFKLFDSKKTLSMVLVQTPKKDIYMVKGKSAIVYLQNNEWIYYESSDNFKLEKTLSITFNKDN